MIFVTSLRTKTCVLTIAPPHTFQSFSVLHKRHKYVTLYTFLARQVHPSLTLSRK